jgi:hypothetical protein
MAEARQEGLPEGLRRELEALAEAYMEVLKRGSAKNEASVLLYSASIYGASRMMANVLGRQCEEQTARVLGLAKEELNRVANYLSEGKEDRRRLLVRLVALEAIIYQVASHCAGLEN